jgi:hypothetical protein
MVLFIVKLPTSAQGSSGFYLCVSNSTLTCFSKWLPSSGGRRCLISYSSNVCIVGVYGLWLSIYTHNTDITSVACKAHTTPWRWQPFAETCRGKIWNTVIKSTTSLRICWSYYDTTRCSVKLSRRYMYGLLNLKFLLLPEQHCPVQMLTAGQCFCIHRWRLCISGNIIVPYTH